MEGSLWQQCLVRLESELPEQQFNTWIRPLHAIENGENLRLLAPNQFVLDWVKKHHFDTISQTLSEVGTHSDARLQLDLPPIANYEPPGCRCADVIQGKTIPPDCALFSTQCTPESPVGPCMVSSEGTCAAHYRYGNLNGS